ncbi:acyl-CoA thioesterase [Desertibacillus haloalkaliphilus]|uniref:acyl-CoA thioesterase n=1 Tax=Desertibacillus haloalkaliphilus TaxID=1328930 RepID=UPI001C261986|nr:acyl-CoA thioesterase [Desertibacillus haloalkaliphilus]MBU8907568.1 acyl-CoA thioesterase [Desertibacillus haloalkaliphilus]
MAYSKLHIKAETTSDHINNVMYMEYLEKARKVWYQFCLSHDVRAMVVNINADYKREMFDQERLTIHTETERVGRTSFTLKQTIINEENELVLSANAVLAVVDRQTKAKTHVPQAIRELVAKKEPLQPLMTN